MQRALEAGKSALLLVPEIGLTPAMAAQMVAAFGGEVALLHSQLTPDERAEQWHRIRRGEARVVVGTRSAVFAPMVNLGLIIVDEEHDSSYKQEETPRYHGRDVAVMRAKLNEADGGAGVGDAVAGELGECGEGPLCAGGDAGAGDGPAAAGGGAGGHARGVSRDGAGADYFRGS